NYFSRFHWMGRILRHRGVCKKAEMKMSALVLKSLNHLYKIFKVYLILALLGASAVVIYGLFVSKPLLVLIAFVGISLGAISAMLWFKARTSSFDEAIDDRKRFITSLPITVNPEILSGTPVFRGTRVPVEALLNNLEAGVSVDQFLENFPTVSREQAL